MTELTAQQIEGRLIAALATITQLWDEMLQPPARRTGGRSGGVILDENSDSDADMPRVVVVVNARHEVMHALRGWCEVIVETHRVNHHIPSGTDVPGMATFLTRWAPRAAEHPAATDILEEIQDCASVVRRCARPTRKTWLSLGPCPLKYTHPDTGQATACPGEVRSHGEDTDDGQSWATCTRCGTRAVAWWWERQMFPDVTEEAQRVRTVTAEEIVTLAHREFGRSITSQAVWQWVKRRHLTPVDPNTKPHRYRLADVLVVLTRMTA